MAWQYSGWRNEETDAGKTAALKSHIQEVVDCIGGKSSISFDGVSWSLQDLTGYYDLLCKDLDALEAAQPSRGPFMRIRNVNWM